MIQKQNIFPSLVSLIFFSIVSLFTFPRSPVAAAVLIHEVFPKPSDGESEWIELYNTSTENISLNQWRLENSNSGTNSFVLNASAIIPGKGFLTFTKSQTKLSLKDEGDTITLVDDKQTVIDKLSYPGILGYNTSFGRSSTNLLSAGPCTTATQNSQNDCPEPSSTPTQIPSEPPAILTPTEIPPATTEPAQPDIQTRTIIETVYVTRIPTPTQTPEDTISFHVSKTISIQVGIVLASWMVLAILATRKKRKRKV